MIDFTEISDGETWELFTRDFLTELGFVIDSPPDRGADGGKDLLASEELSGRLSNYRFQWLVSCKHNATAGRSVTEGDEPNILERVEGFASDGFIGFYSTVPSAGLNDRLRALRQAGKLRDYRIFDHKLIENYLIRVGYSELVMRYFPESYRKIRPLHQVANEYVPLSCAVCEKDLLEALDREHYEAIIGFAKPFAWEPSADLPEQVESVFWVCKGE